MVGDQLDSPYRPDGTICRDSQIAGRLRRAGVGVVTELGKESRYGISIAQNLHIVRIEFDVQEMRPSVLHNQAVASVLRSTTPSRSAGLNQVLRQIRLHVRSCRTALGQVWLVVIARNG